MPGISTAVVNCVLEVGIDIDDVCAKHALLGGVLDVHDRRCAGDGDRFLDGADLQSTFTVAANDPVSSMPSRLTVLKPDSANVTA